MKLNALLGPIAIIALVNACGAPPGKDPGPGHNDGEAGDGNGYADGLSGDGGSDIDAGDDGDSDISDAGDDGDDGDSDTGSKDDGHDDAGANGDRDDDHDDGSGDTGGDGDSNGKGSGGSAGLSGSGVSSAGASSGGSAGLAANGGASSGGSAGLAANGGASSGGSAGRPGGGGSGGGDDSSDGGFAGLAESGGSGGVPSRGGSGGLAESGGSAGVAESGGSAGLAESGGTGGAGNGGSGGLVESGGAGGTSGSGGDLSLDPEYLFTTEEFGGNGRTCVTCHTAETGTINPSQIEALYTSDPGDPLFRSIDSDDGFGESYTQLRERATFRATIELPPGVFLTSDPSATSVVLRRSVPTTINTPALDPVIMWDGRAPDLMEQAHGAILGHAQATVLPTSAQLERIAQWEQGPNFFSSDLLRDYAQGGPAPTWPAGTTAEEQRGRRWFAEDSAAPRFNICGQCHGGPMTNETQANSGLPVGKHFQTANVSEFNARGNPVYEFTFPDPKSPGKTVTVRTPDPGRALVTGDVRDLNFFKIPTLWGVKNTAPYFHDHSAQTLEELMDHYEQHLGTFLPNNRSYPSPHVPTAQDKADIVAYLKLL